MAGIGVVVGRKFAHNLGNPTCMHLSHSHSTIHVMCKNFNILFGENGAGVIAKGTRFLFDVMKMFQNGLC